MSYLIGACCLSKGAEESNDYKSSFFSYCKGFYVAVFYGAAWCQSDEFLRCMNFLLHSLVAYYVDLLIAEMVFHHCCCNGVSVGYGGSEGACRDVDGGDVGSGVNEEGSWVTMFLAVVICT